MVTLLLFKFFSIKFIHKSILKMYNFSFLIIYLGIQKHFPK